jgi:hypothetical protein
MNLTYARFQICCVGSPTPTISESRNPQRSLAIRVDELVDLVFGAVMQGAHPSINAVRESFILN